MMIPEINKLLGCGIPKAEWFSLSSSLDRIQRSHILRSHVGASGGIEALLAILENKASGRFGTKSLRGLQEAIWSRFWVPNIFHGNHCRKIWRQSNSI